MSSVTLHTAELHGLAVVQPVSEQRVYGMVSVLLELCLLVENLLPVLTVLFWRRPRPRAVRDKLLAALSAAYVMSALIPRPLGLVSYFNGTWYGGQATCECFQVSFEHHNNYISLRCLTDK